jgi:uncharacterized membrane-anchored protein
MIKPKHTLIGNALLVFGFAVLISSVFVARAVDALIALGLALIGLVAAGIGFYMKQAEG